MRKSTIKVLALGCYSIFMIGAAACNNNNAHDELAHHHHDHAHAHGHDSHDHAHEDEETEVHGHEGHDHGNGPEIILEPAQAKLLGVETAEVKPITFNTIVKVSGEIVETTAGSSVASAPTAGIVTFAPGINVGGKIAAGTLVATVKSAGMSGGDPNAAARVAVKAAQTEIDRLKPLYDNGIVSAAEYNAAVARLESAKASYSPSASSGRIIAPASGTIVALDVRQGEYVDAGMPVLQISGSEVLTLRADLPQRYFGEMADFSSAKVRTAYSTDVLDLADMNCKRINGETAPRVTGGYVPVYFSFTNNGTLMPGSAVEVYLEGAPRANVITVPMTSISEQQGNHFVYIRLDEEGYLKTPVTLGESDGERVEILSGVHSGDQVVVKGTTSVRLAESSNVVPEGHSHNH